MKNFVFVAFCKEFETIFVKKSLNFGLFSKWLRFRNLLTKDKQ